jgi:ribosomal protein L24E
MKIACLTARGGSPDPPLALALSVVLVVTTGGLGHAHDSQFSIGEQGVEGGAVKVEGGGSLSFDVRQGLAAGQVVDGDCVSLPVGAGEEDVAADGRVGFIRSSLQAEAALLRPRRPRSGTWTPRSRMMSLEDGPPTRRAMALSSWPLE